MLARAPRTNRELFELFRLYRNPEGLDSLLDSIDFGGVTSGQIHYSVFNRLQEAAGALNQAEGYNPRQHLKHCLGTEGFQKNVLDRLLTAYSEKRRLLLVHIPKCAGSDLTMHLMERHPPLNQRITDRNWMPSGKLYPAIRRLVEQLGFSDTVFVHGHIQLQQYLAARQVRFGDQVFSVLREPADMVISKINYVITRFRRDPELKAIDTNDWLRFLKRETVDAALASGDIMELATAMLQSPNMVQPNTICAFLGTGDTASALSMCAQADVELTDVLRYQPWLKERWGVNAETRQNASDPHISLSDFSSQDLARINALTAEDRKLHDGLRARLDASNSLSLRGLQLARQTL